MLLCRISSSTAPYHGEEVLLKKGDGEDVKYLVRWIRQQEKEDEAKTHVAAVPSRPSGRDITIWMNSEELLTCCPHLNSLSNVDSKPSSTTNTVVGVSTEEEDLLSSDVTSLITRAKRLNLKLKASNVNDSNVTSTSIPHHLPSSESLLTNTVNILSTYAKIPSLSHSFKQSGIIDLLLDLLSSRLPAVRSSASDMLRSFARYDPASRSYVLLKLTQSEEEGIASDEGEGSTASQDMLMELFAETSQVEEDEEISEFGDDDDDDDFIPQVPVKYLHSLLKNYLRVTSDPSPSAFTSNPIEDFNHFSLLFELLSQLFVMFGWVERNTDQNLYRGKSIFSSGSLSGKRGGMLPRKPLPSTSSSFKSRSDFNTNSSYMSYVSSRIEPGMTVRSRVNKEFVHMGDIGKYVGQFAGPMRGLPFIEVLWEDVGMMVVQPYEIELVGRDSSSMTNGDDRLKSHHSLDHTLVLSISEKCRGGAERNDKIFRAHWWEVLCLVKKLPVTHRQEIIKIIKDPVLKEFNDLITYLPTYEQISAIVQYCDTSCPQLDTLMLSIRTEDKFVTILKNTSSQPPRPSTPTPSISYQLSPPYPEPFYEEEASEKDESWLESMESSESDYHDYMSVFHHVSLNKAMKLKEKIEKKLLKKGRKSCRFAVYSLRSLNGIVKKIDSSGTRMECALSGTMSLVIKLMAINTKSPLLQSTGLQCLYAILGGHSLHEGIPILPFETRPLDMTEVISSSIITTLISLKGSSSESLLRLREAMDCIINYYNLNVSSDDKKLYFDAIRCGLSIILTLLYSDNAHKLCTDWSLHELIRSLKVSFPDFPLKDKLISLIVSVIPDDPANNSDTTVDKEIIHLVKLLSAYSGHTSKNPVPRLLQLFEEEEEKKKVAVSDVANGCSVVELFLRQRGIIHLSIAIKTNSLLHFMESGLKLLLTVINTGPECASLACLQGAQCIINTALSSRFKEKVASLCWSCINSLRKHSELIEFVVTRKMNNLLRKSLVHTKDFQEKSEFLKQQEKLLEKRTNSKQSVILKSLLKGLMEHLMTEIENERRSKSYPCLPYLSSFIRFMSNDNGVFISDRNKCWDRVEVSSNEYRKMRMLDGDLSTHWESSGQEGSHWIRLHMIKNVVVRKLSIGVCSSDLNYMPQVVVVQGGKRMDNMTDLNTVSIPFTHSGMFEILSNCANHYPIIIIRIKKCHQDGVNVKIKDISVEGAQMSRWALFGSLFIERTQLFYEIMQHLWIKELSSSPLALFERINSVMNYEQSFADSYLFTLHSRQALGTACQTALLNPLATRITSNSCWGEILIKLLSEYISNYCPTPSSPYKELLTHEHFIDKVPSNAETLIKLSQIRRMCRLLVSVCNSKTQEATGDSSELVVISDALAKSWRDAVSQKVSCVLNRINFTSPPFVVLTDLLYLYDKIIQGTRELFGSQSSLFLSVSDGYCIAFQGLNEVKSVKLCEMLSLCFHHLLSKEHSLVHSPISDTVRETVLLSFADTLAFIHSLDISNIFEHFYRRHLSERLLSNCLLSVAMEVKVIEALENCFPSQYPQQMLIDLKESEKLMKSFTQDYMVDSIDSLLTTEHGNRDSVSSDIMELAERLSYYRTEQSLRVTLLAPHKWSLKHKPLPLPLPDPTLNTFLNDYTKFYTSSSLKFLYSHEKLRQISWTLYGSATLIYQDCLSIDVSTTQMIILLQFNKAEKLTYLDLLEDTQLPYKEVNHSLTLMMQKGQKILSSSHSINTYKHTTVFTINEKFIKSLTGKMPHPHVCVRSTKWIEQNDDSIGLISVIERRRSVIDSVIIRLLKKEKTLTTDNLISTVINGFAKGEFVGIVYKYKRFNCSHDNVLSRIESLTSRGYIKQYPSTPHVLEYVSDTVLVKHVDVTPPELTNIRSPNGLPHKRGSSSPLINSSKKKMKLRRDEEKKDGDSERDDDEVLLINLSLGTRTRTMEDIKTEINKEVDSLSDVMKVPSNIIEVMLCQLSWNKDVFLQRYFEDKESLFISCGVSAEVGPPPPPTIPDTCPVCFSELSQSSSYWLWCQHVCCKSCWGTYLTEQVMSLNHALSCTCIVSGCKAKVTGTVLLEILKTKESEVFIEYGKALVRSYVESNGFLTWCHNPTGCDFILYRDDGHKDITCGQCGWSSCLSCTFTEAHQPLSCDQLVKWMGLGGFYDGMDGDARSKHLANIISKRCPGCNAQIEKNEGCLHMKCNCGHHFCWRCMNPWQPTHTDYFKCSAKVNESVEDSTKFVYCNQRCVGYHKSKLSVENLQLQVRKISESTSLKILSTVNDACLLLQQSYKVLLYSCIVEYFSESGSYVSFLTSSLESNVITLRRSLENIFSHGPPQSLKDACLSLNGGLINRVTVLKNKLLTCSDQYLKLGHIAPEPLPPEQVKDSNTSPAHHCNNSHHSDSWHAWDDSDDYDDDHYCYGSDDYDDYNDYHDYDSDFSY